MDVHKAAGATLPHASSPSPTEQEGRPMHVLMRPWRDLFRKAGSPPLLT